MPISANASKQLKANALLGSPIPGPPGSNEPRRQGAPDTVVLTTDLIEKLAVMVANHIPLRRACSLVQLAYTRLQDWVAIGEMPATGLKTKGNGDGNGDGNGERNKDDEGPAIERMEATRKGPLRDQYRIRVTGYVLKHPSTRIVSRALAQQLVLRLNEASSLGISAQIRNIVDAARGGQPVLKKRLRVLEYDPTTREPKIVQETTEEHFTQPDIKAAMWLLERHPEYRKEFSVNVGLGQEISLGIGTRSGGQTIQYGLDGEPGGPGAGANNEAGVEGGSGSNLPALPSFIVELTSEPMPEQVTDAQFNSDPNRASMDVIRDRVSASDFGTGPITTTTTFNVDVEHVGPDVVVPAPSPDSDSKPESEPVFKPVTEIGKQDARADDILIEQVREAVVDFPATTPSPISNNRKSKNPWINQLASKQKPGPPSRK